MFSLFVFLVFCSNRLLSFFKNKQTKTTTAKTGLESLCSCGLRLPYYIHMVYLLYFAPWVCMRTCSITYMYAVLDFSFLA